MPKTYSHNLSCPCCLKLRSYENATPLPDLEEEILQKQLLWWGKPGWILNEAKKGTLQWACSHCLKKQKAIRAYPEAQKYLDHPPYLAYFATEIACEDCKETFVFSAQEQQYWYEELCFWVQSRPKHCKTCRQIRRERRQEQSERQKQTTA